MNSDFLVLCDQQGRMGRLSEESCLSSATMHIRLSSLLEGAQRAPGVVALIDVFRAFTTGAVALANGAERIIMVSRVAEALALRDAGVGHICIGETRGRKPAAFGHGNSPHEIAGVDFGGKTLIQ